MQSLAKQRVRFWTEKIIYANIKQVAVIIIIYAGQEEEVITLDEQRRAIGEGDYQTIYRNPAVIYGQEQALGSDSG